MQTARLLEHSLGQGITLEMDLTPQPTWVRMGEGAIAQVLINLAINDATRCPRAASKYRDRSGNAGRGIRRSAAGLPAGEDVRLVVRDTGTGMTAETQARAFDCLFTTKPAGRGTGLGLASVRWAVEQCGGSVHLHSATGEGTTFTILFGTDGRRGSRRQRGGSRRCATRHVTRGDGPGRRDDEAVVRDIVAAMLRDSGYTVIEAAAADEALAWAKSGRHIDLLLADMAMQDMSGFELARRFTAVALDVRVLFMSGYND